MITAHIIRRFAFTEWGGAESVVWNTVRTLQSKGNRAEIFATRALSPNGNESKASVAIHRFPYHYPYMPLSRETIRALDRKGGNPVVPGLRQALTEGAFDLLHCHTMGRMALEVRAAAKKIGVPYVLSLHDGCFDVPKEETRQEAKTLKGAIPYGDIMDRLLGRRIDPMKDAGGIVCVSENELAQTKEHFPGKPVAHIPDGVDYAYFHEADAAGFCSHAGVPQGRKLLLCVSRIDDRKNQLMLPDVLAGLGDPWHLVLIGAPTADSYTENLREKIRGLNLTDRVTLITSVPPDSSLLPAAYRAASAFLIPSLHEPFGIVVLEAWSAGVPVIASPVDGLKKLIREGETGFFAPPDAPDKWAEAVRRLDSDPDLRASITSAADAEVRANYSWGIVTDRLLEFYQEVQRIHRRR